MRHKSSSVGEIDEHPATGAIHTKDGVGSTLPRKKRKKKVGNMKVLERKKVGHMKVQEREKEKKSERKKVRMS